jgi:hypothetical protein
MFGIMDINFEILEGVVELGMYFYYKFRLRIRMNNGVSKVYKVGVVLFNGKGGWVRFV